jgi:YHS domain-containing protein/thiol-disulfide isomerase/thioredoxin
MIHRKYPSIRAFAGVVLGVRLAALSLAPALAAGPGSIDWRTDYPRAQQEAQARNLPLWIQFTASWCHYCQRMDHETFADPRVIAQTRDRFVAVKLQSEVHEDLAVAFGVTALPASVIVKPSGGVIATHTGYLETESFQSFMRRALARFGPPHSPETAAQMAEIVPTANADVALAGYCPVSLVREQRLVPGQEGVTLEPWGQLYRFANPHVRTTFLKQPERYVPVNGGRCPVVQVDRGEGRRGDPRYGVLYGGHLYLCADETSRQRFVEQPGRYAHVNMAEREFCPHCWGRTGLMSRHLVPSGALHFEHRDRPAPSRSLEAIDYDPETVRR